MSGFTEGPWEIGYVHWGKADIYVKRGDGALLINGVPCTYVARDLLPADANIARAAPELYEALRGMVGLIQLIEARPDLPPTLRDALSHRLGGARAALAKAVPPGPPQET